MNVVDTFKDIDTTETVKQLYVCVVLLHKHCRNSYIITVHELVVSGSARENKNPTEQKSLTGHLT